MVHFRDARPGHFYLQDEHVERVPASPSEIPPFLRFAAKQGVAVDLWTGEAALPHQLLSAANLGWPVARREVMVPAGPGIAETTTASHYRALVRPDTQQIMSVVTSGYAVAENAWVGQATAHYASRTEYQPAMIAAVGFGRDGERTMFAARVTGDDNDAVCLLAYNTHGGEGAVRFQLIECDRRTRATYVLDHPDASWSFAHVGDLQDRLEVVSRPGGRETVVERYLAETRPLWDRLHDTVWTRRHTAALIKALWGETPDPREGFGDRLEGHDRVKARHPGHHLPPRMAETTDAANAYRAICEWLDNQSEACERGDFTKDRDERLALGAGNKYKRSAWKWILNNV